MWQNFNKYMQIPCRTAMYTGITLTTYTHLLTGSNTGRNIYR